MHPLIGNLVSRPEGGLDAFMYNALNTELSLDDALNLAEIDEVQRSWRDATQANVEERAAVEREKRERDRG
jgi:hypothetical protein